ncbi:hypothetical protein MY4824_002294 [Beauveria thailandica]
MSTPRGDDVVTQSQVADSDARDYFNLLPNEIFTLVLDLVEKPEIDSQVLTGLDPTELDLRKLRKAKKGLHDLALVNRRFNALATPLLYKCIDVIYRQSWDNHWTGMEAISQTLKKKTYLRRYIRKFRLILAPRSFNDARLNKKILENNDTASLRKLQLHDILNNPEATMKSLLKWSKSLKELSLRARNHHSFRIDLQNLLSPYNDTLVVLYLDIRIAPDQIDFSSLSALEELTLVYWPLIADTRVEFSEDVGRRLLAPRMRRLNWLLVGETKPDLYINSLTTFDEKWLCDLGEYATQHCSRLRIIYAKHNPRLQLDVALLPVGAFFISVRELDMPEDIFGRVQLSFKTLGLDFRYSTVSEGGILRL